MVRGVRVSPTQARGGPHRSDASRHRCCVSLPPAPITSKHPPSLSLAPLPLLSSPLLWVVYKNRPSFIYFPWCVHRPWKEDREKSHKIFLGREGGHIRVWKERSRRRERERKKSMTRKWKKWDNNLVSLPLPSSPLHFLFYLLLGELAGGAKQ